MSSPPSDPGEPKHVPFGFNLKTFAALAAIVSLIIVGLYQFDQIEASIYAYYYGAIHASRPLPSPVPSGRSLS